MPYNPHGAKAEKKLTPEQQARLAVRRKILKFATKHETFRTPHGLFRLFLKTYGEFVVGRCLDPSAGDGRWFKTLLKAKSHRKTTDPRGHLIMDIREKEKKRWKKYKPLSSFLPRQMKIENYLKTKLKAKYDTAFTNPPFTLSEKFVEKMLLDVKQGGHVIILEKQSFDTGQKRSRWMDTQPLKYIINITFRLKFDIDLLLPEELMQVTYNHAFFVFQKGYKGPVTRLYLHKD